MDNEMYVSSRPDKNWYTLRIKNVGGLSNQELMAKFSKFGKVETIKVAGDKYGHRFIIYNQYSDAVNAYSALFQKDKSITILKSIDHIERIRELDNNSEQSSICGNRKQGVLHNKKQNSSTTNQFSKKKNNEGSISENKNIDLSQIPPLLDQGKLQKMKVQPSGESIKNAHAIIVANVQLNFGANYILHLFDIFKPIAISAVKITKMGSRYYYVYFKNIEDATMAQKEYDHFCLGGEYLIIIKK